MYLFLSSPSLAQPKVELVESVWNLGAVAKGTIIEKTIRIKNIGNDKLVINKVRASCECITLYILTNGVSKGGFAEIKACFDTTKRIESRFTKYIYIQSNDPNKPIARITVKGILENGLIVQEDKSTKKSGINGNEKINVVLFYSPGCQGCRQIKDVFLNQLANRYNIEVKTYDITIMDNYLKLMDFERQYKVEENDPMIVFAGNRYFSGKNAILNGLKTYIKHLSMTGRIKSRVEGNADKNTLFTRFKSFSPLLIVTAGLIDGINPCAFVTIVFLVSFLYFIEKKRRDVFFIGLIYLSAVFLTYLLIGLGLFGMLYKLTVFSIVSQVMYVIVICIVFMLAFYSIYDSFVYLNPGTTKNIKLQLSQKVKIKIHAIIRRNLGNKGLFISAVVTGFLVSLLEGVCTGQVYLPTIMFMVREPSAKACGFSYLVLYNLAFIFPLLVVIVLVVLGISTKRLVYLSTKNTFIAKLLLSLLFFILGIFLILIG